MPIGGGDSPSVFVQYAKSKKSFKKVLTFRFCSVRMVSETGRTEDAKPIEKFFQKVLQNLLTNCSDCARMGTENKEGRENGGRFIRSLKIE